MPRHQPNTITVERRFKGHHLKVRARYDENADGWTCDLRDPVEIIEWRTPDQCGNDVWAAITDMIDSQISRSVW